MAYKTQNFVLTMTGTEMPLTLVGLGTPSMTIKADSNNLQVVYIGNIFENGNDNGGIRTLDANNNKDYLRPGKEVTYANDVQYDRLPRHRSPFTENNQRHLMSQWYVNGAVGDLVFVTWDDENEEIRDVHNALIDRSAAGLSR